MFSGWIPQYIMEDIDIKFSDLSNCLWSQDFRFYCPSINITEHNSEREVSSLVQTKSPKRMSTNLVTLPLCHSNHPNTTHFPQTPTI